MGHPPCSQDFTARLSARDWVRLFDNSACGCSRTRFAVKLLVVVLNYRVAGLTIDCLRSLAPQMLSFPGCKVAVVENGSADGSAECLHEAVAEADWQQWVEFLPLPENLGFTKGNNYVLGRALQSADPPEYILLLNADTVPTADALSQLVRFMDGHPAVGIAGARLEYPDGRPQGSPFRFPTIASEFDRGLGLGIVSRWLANWAVCPPKPRVASPVDWVAGAAMMVRREVMERIGLLDEGYFAYFEDTDYCLQARRAGWSTWYVPESLVVHLEGSSSGIDNRAGARLPAYWFRARRRFFLKNHGPVYAMAADAAFLMGSAFGAVRRMLQGKRSPNPPWLLRDSMLHSVFLTGFRTEHYS